MIEKRPEPVQALPLTPPGSTPLEPASATVFPTSPRPPRPLPEQQKMELGVRPSLTPPAPGEFRIPPANPVISSPGPLPEPTSVEEAEIADLEIPAPAPVEAAPRYGNRLGCLGTRGAESAHSQLKAAANLTLIAEEINPLGQLHQSFIIAADRAGLLLIDQHVAHERILFEYHWQALRSHRLEVQRLLIPETLDLTPAQVAAFDQLLPELEENGFELGRLSGRTIAVKALPAMLKPGTAQALLLELLEAIEEDRRGLSLDELRAEIAASLACRAAVKINMKLAPEKIDWLIDELLKMENPATCPHGRPIILRITMRDIERGFQRS
jgi:DNA mismatch repair protein MutL